LQSFAALAEIPGVRLFSLQTEQAAEEIASLTDGQTLINLMPEVNDFLDTAAILANLDLIITVDTGVAHLAGALGLPTWMLLQHVPDWRWLMEREDTPWYPTMRLFRQPKRGDWQSVGEKVANELRNLTPRPPSLPARCASLGKGEAKLDTPPSFSKASDKEGGRSVLTLPLPLGSGSDRQGRGLGG
jgi:hypothetical protein